MRNGLIYERRDTRRSTSIPLTSTYPFTNSSKRPSNDTIIGPLVNSRRTSRCVFNVQEL